MSLPVNGVTGHTYQGENVLNLWLESMMKGFTSNEWASARQWHEANPEATIKPEYRRGGSLIHFVGKVWVPKDERTGDPEEDAKKARPFMKTHFVYNRDQIDGLPALAVTVLPDRTCSPGRKCGRMIRRSWKAGCCGATTFGTASRSKLPPCLSGIRWLGCSQRGQLSLIR